MKGSKKVIALIAHDNKKQEIIDWAKANRQLLAGYELCGTGHTSRMVAEATGLEVTSFLSGPLGGDQQIGAHIAEGKIDMVVFFWVPVPFRSVWKARSEAEQALPESFPRCSWRAWQRYRE